MELGRGVKAKVGWIYRGLMMRLNPDKVEITYTQSLSLGAPKLRCSTCIGEHLGPVDKKHGSSVDTKVSRIGEGVAQPPHMGQVVLFRVSLSN